MEARTGSVRFVTIIFLFQNLDPKRGPGPPERVLQNYEELIWQELTINRRIKAEFISSNNLTKVNSCKCF